MTTKLEQAAEEISRVSKEVQSCMEEQADLNSLVARSEGHAVSEKVARVYSLAAKSCRAISGALAAAVAEYRLKAAYEKAKESPTDRSAWTTEKPTEPGLFGFCAPTGAWRTMIVVRITRNDDGCWVDQGRPSLYTVAQYPDGYWLKLPEIPK